MAFESASSKPGTAYSRRQSNIGSSLNELADWLSLQQARQRLPRAFYRQWLNTKCCL